MKKFIIAVISAISLSAHAGEPLFFTPNDNNVDMTIETDKQNPILVVAIDMDLIEAIGGDSIVVELDTNKKDCYGIGKIVDEESFHKMYFKLKLTKACHGAVVKSASIVHKQDSGGKKTYYFKPEDDKTI